MAKRIKNNETRELEGVGVLYPNFNGDPDSYNAMGGKRYFTAKIEDPVVANNLRDEGWYVRPVFSRDDPDEILYWTIKVNVKYHPTARRFDPQIWEVTPRRKVKLSEDLVGTLDNADIEYGDITISAYDYSDGGAISGNGTGISAYLKEGYFVIRESRFASKYSDLDDSDDLDDIPF